ncbi:MAG: glutamine amidotransferase [Neisseriaceae bacterium]|nr:MAG: glutamine amidotransferase [Neisseriaceae bacterium]
MRLEEFILTKKVQIIRHVLFEDLGSFANALQNLGYQIEYLDSGVDKIPDRCNADWLIVLGGPIGVNDVLDFPYLTAEINLIKQYIKANKAVLGICLGSQLLAASLGAEVEKNSQVELGWSQLTLCNLEMNDCFQHLAKIEVLHWHGDTFKLPANAILKASTPICTNQAFTIGNKIMGLQFHPEVTTHGMERWLIGNAAEINQLEHTSISKLREENNLYGRNLEQAAERFLTHWINNWEVLLDK